MNPSRLLLIAALAVPGIAAAQEGVLVTQTLVRAESKADVMPTAESIKLEVNSKQTPLLALTPIKPSGVQVALLIDDGLSRGAGLQLNEMRDFAGMLPPDVELMVGYMQNGTVRVASPFSTDRAAAVQSIRMPMGLPGESASPYFCLSEFVKNWPQSESGSPKARIVMMITNGVDPYNGSTRMSNQDSPYVASAVIDAQRAGVAVYSIYYRDSGFRGGGASFSGQSYLQQVADGTGGNTYYQGEGNPVSIGPFFKEFVHDIAETYVATFNTTAEAGGREHLVRIKVSTNTPKVKVKAPAEVRPGNREAAVARQ
jgi:hypothetical protein